MARYYEADEAVRNMMDEVVDERFPNLRPAGIKILMDNKPKIDKLTQRMTFASIKAANEVERFLTKDGHHIGGFDYIMFLNDLVWELANAVDKKRIISHELRHAVQDDKGNFKIQKHDIEDFHAEIKINEGDPMWAQALGTIAVAKHDQMKAEAKATGF